ncbi:winged helix-turn-helix transcriptional regulator [Actinokineospora auranticolor]|uniref:DNA-binding HxlR family transcriptional regulator n=1 Tax=Actinokineospora auranticolor TaxID=155976 RepID=A0A2S6GC60_9PSEU|nr:winged helix-turn-helix transcriptional regulator [Actinokineospora auranticolor]PPK62192.1 DNA-binding HxlR family transcriptional regulator [Actinokineospora auranticolor]
MIHPPDRPSQLGAGGDNAIALTIGTAADEWTLLILRHALQRGTRHARRWQELLPISPAVLASRLRHLSDQGVLVRADQEWQLSPRGAALWPMMLSVWAWEVAWADGPGPDLPAMRHADCGALFEPVLACGTCRVAVAPRDVEAEFGPSGSWPRSAPITTLRRRASGSTSLGPGFFPQSRALIGNRWSAAMLGAVFLGARRFSDFQRRLGAPTTVVADRLRTFRALGFLTASGDPDRSDRSVYRLTDKGRAFFPAIMTGLDWGQRWFLAPEGPAVLLRHRGTDHEYHVTLVCSACSRPLAGRSVRSVPVV